MMKLMFVAWVPLVGCVTDPADEETRGTSAQESRNAHDARLRAAGETKHRMVLHTTIGPYVFGTASVFRGTFEARDNASVLGRPDGVIPAGPAIATLTPDGFAAGTDLLRVTAGAQQVDIVQAGFRSSMSSVMPRRSSTSGFAAYCEDCLPILDPARPTLAFSDFTVTGFYASGQPFEAHASGSFARLPAESLSFDDLVDAQVIRDDHDYAAAGEDLVRTARDVHAENIPVAPGTLGCGLETRYAIDYRIPRARAANFSVADYRVEGEQVCCATGVPERTTCRPLELARELTTGVGAGLRVAVVGEVVDTADVLQGRARVEYVDRHGYFGGASSLRAVLLIHAFQHERVVTTVELTRGSDGTYAGGVRLAHPHPVQRIEVAVSDASGSRWDSNLSRNYKLTF